MNDRILFAVLCLLFNAIGVPCFMQGNVGKGVKRIILGVVTFGIIALINAIKGIILGIQILQMSDAEYESKKGTFDSGIPA